MKTKSKPKNPTAKSVGVEQLRLDIIGQQYLIAYEAREAMLVCMTQAVSGPLGESQPQIRSSLESMVKYSPLLQKVRTLLGNIAGFKQRIKLLTAVLETCVADLECLRPELSPDGAGHEALDLWISDRRHDGYPDSFGVWLALGDEQEAAQ